MPSRWFVPVPGVDPARVRLEHVHAAFSRWFDLSPAEHSAMDKPYRISPLTPGPGGVPGVEVALLSEVARQRFEAAAPGAGVRLGNQLRRVGVPKPLEVVSWQDLAAARGDRRWELEFLTPTTFRTGDRSSPLPRVDTILDGLHRAWQLWSDVELGVAEQDWAAVWVSDIDLRNSTIELRVRRRDGSTQPITVSGALGVLVLRCDSPDVADRVGPLLRLAAFAGVGGMTLKGLGVTRVSAQAARGGRPSGAATGSSRPGPDAGTDRGDGTAG